MLNGRVSVPVPVNEPNKMHAPGSPERAELKAKLTELASQQIEIPCIINGKEVKTGNLADVVMPHDTKKVIARYHQPGPKEMQAAIDGSLEAWKTWTEAPWEDRASVFLKAAELLSTRHRALINASTMLSLSKNAFQAEIDAACELIDFLNFNVHYMTELYTNQPMYSPKGTWNYAEMRPLEGFVFAIPPFNFTAIACNLPTAPAIMGNVSVWKPAENALYAPYFFMKILQEAGLPDGVIQFLPGPGAEIGKVALSHPELAGVHFTGSVGTFQHIWKEVGANVGGYRNYPRVVGETGGKDFVVAHPSANIRKLVIALVRGSFEYQGQKCSAASRAYIPKSIWGDVRGMLEAEVKSIKMGDVTDFSNFMNAVIDEKAFKKITSYIDYAKNSKDAEIILGGGYDDSTGWFVEPTVILTTDPKFKTIEEEIFGPVLTVYVYDDAKFADILELCDATSPYALTGAVFATDRDAVQAAMKKLRYAAGNFYVNDKPTGSIVGQQPFGGARASGTNDKAGSPLNMLRWGSPRAVKETFDGPEDYRYPFMDEK